ncbi:MAG: cytochrome c oxidase subunit II [Chloroflexi bacterium]|nr:cytochrome c oxidase subunit II [Chloroflexota bacterium]
MKRDMLIAGALWGLLTLVGEVWALTTEFNPPGYAAEARLVDDAFQTMMVLGVPVFALVIAFLGYAVVRFRDRGDPPEDGPPLREHRPLIVGWLGVTTGLTVLVIINPGIVGMLELRHEHPADLVVQVEGFRWAWRVHYPEYNLTTTELVLPVDQRVQFDVTATDVLHSFWIPAFRVKIDAVPGLVTRTYATPTITGSFAGDDQLRVQCAELCGLAHNLMRTPVRVVAQTEFDAWVAQQRAAAR